LADAAELRVLSVDHAEELFLLINRNRERLRQWLPWVDAVGSVEDERNYLRNVEEQRAKEVLFVTGIFVEGRVVGSVGVHPIDRANRKAEIGYWLDQGSEGKGLMTSACRVVVDHLFREVGLNRVMIYSATENSRSRAVAERLGFKFEGVHREASWLCDRFVDLASYAMVAREWKM